MLLGLPTAVWSSLASFVLSFLASREKSRREVEEARHKRTLELFAAQNKGSADFIKGEKVKQQDPHFSFTRRTLALGTVFGTMFLLLGGSLFFPELLWIYETTVSNNGFFGLGASEVTEFIQVNGVPILFGEAFLHFTGIVISFYFGNKIGSVKNPY